MGYVAAIKNPDISVERLRLILRYDTEIGHLYWNWRGDVGAWWNGRYAGKRAATNLDSKGYFCLTIDDHKYRAHRVIWAHVTGEWPDAEVDHRDTNRQNNRFDNLRKASVEQQRMNMRRHKDNETGFKGVSRNKEFGFRSRIWIAGKEMTAYFKTAEEAHADYVEKAKKHFGEFAQSGTH